MLAIIDHNQYQCLANGHVYAPDSTLNAPIDKHMFPSPKL